MVKVLKFLVSNWASGALSTDEPKKVSCALQGLSSPEDIEEAVNKACYGLQVKSMTVTPVETAKHNNARGNTVELWYTIVLESW